MDSVVMGRASRHPTDARFTSVKVSGDFSSIHRRSSVDVQICMRKKRNAPPVQRCV